MLDHLRNELRDEIQSRQAIDTKSDDTRQLESDSTSSASLPAMPRTAEANKRVDYEHPSDSESSDSGDSSSSEDSSSSDSWISTTRKSVKSKGKKGKRLSRKKLSKEQRKRKHFKKVTKLTSRLTTTADRFHLKALPPAPKP